MTPSLVLCFSLGGWCSGAPPLPDSSIPVLPSLDQRQRLERVRRGNALIEANIELFEGLLKDHPNLFSPEKASDIRQELEVWREELAKWKRWERELEFWEQQRELKPGLETEQEASARLGKLFDELWLPVAPMPREVKPKPPAPTPQK